MELYIQVRDGVAFEHPMLGDNFRETHPDIDVNNLPPEFAKFTRYDVPSPLIMPCGILQVHECKYVLDTDGKSWRDEWSVRDMNAEEKAEIVERCKNNRLFASWTFDENTCYWIPPTPMPNDGFLYDWNESTLAWVRFVISPVPLSEVSFV